MTQETAVELKTGQGRKEGEAQGRERRPLASTVVTPCWLPSSPYRGCTLPAHTGLEALRAQGHNISALLTHRAQVVTHP